MVKVMSCEKWLDPFDTPPPEKVVSGRLETRDSRVVVKVSHVLNPGDHEKLQRYAERKNLTVQLLLHGIVEDFLRGLPEPPKNS